jgi:hypothetical protein
MFSVIAKLAVRPPDPVQKVIAEIKSMIGNTTLIGIQLRATEQYSISLAVFDSFLRCATQAAKPYPNSLFFIASDSNRVRKMVKKKFGNRILDFDYLINRYKLTASQYALFDLYMLSECKELILTPYSTFGTVSASISGVTPYYIERVNGVCLKDIFSTSKFHYFNGYSKLKIPHFQSSDTINQFGAFL